MEGIIVNFRGGRHTHYPNQMIIKINEINNKEKAKSLLNKKVTWTSPSGKKIIGIISNIHGNSGALKAKFEKGLPGQSIGAKVKVE